MYRFLTCIITAAVFLSAAAYKYNYAFRDTPVAEAIVRLSKEHPEVNVSFIYKELNNYRTSASINTDDLGEALRQIVGVNPITVIRKGNNLYVEALQHGKFKYTGRAIGTDGEAVAAATVFLLSPKDSTIITYGLTDDAGRFSIPCDRNDVIGKFSCVGHKTTFRRFKTFAVGTVIIPEFVRSLKGITVETDHTILYPDKSVYIPTSRQKNSSQTALDLLQRMAIPQLGTSSELTTVTRQPVEIFIDFYPATSDELKGMRLEDVKRIEYYDYPADPRFQGKPHVVNFIMQKYEYGGYVKGYYDDSFVNSRQINAYAKFQYKRMVFDWSGNAYFSTDRKTYDNTKETFRLPQEDGTIKEFERTSVVDRKELRSNPYWTSFKALYKSDATSISNMVTLNYTHTPRYSMERTVSYTPEVHPTSSARSYGSSDIKSVAYNGYWYFRLPAGDYFVFTPKYAYTSTIQENNFDEDGFLPILNGADDSSHQASVCLSFTHSFGKAGQLTTSCEGKFLQNRTHYSGSSSIADLARTYRVGPGVNYSYSLEKLYLEAGLGLFWDRSAYSTIIENSVTPWVELATQYAFNTHNSVSINFTYNQWEPSSSYRSAAVIEQNHFLRHTGNPSLVPFDSYSLDVGYNLVPTRHFSLSAYGHGWIVGNRYVYDYEANASGILRTIKQPLGKYSQWQYGLQGRLRLFDNSLFVNMTVGMYHAHNGTPYNWTKSSVDGYLSVYYYLNDFYFGGSYRIPGGYSDGCMVGKWISNRDSYSLTVGWALNHWNIRLYTYTFLRHNTYSSKGIMLSKYYDCVEYDYSALSRYFKISVTYTFGFGKRVKAEEEAYQASGAASGILK